MALSDEQFALICRRVEEGKVESIRVFELKIDVGPFEFSGGMVDYVNRKLEKCTDENMKREKLEQARKSDQRYEILRGIVRKLADVKDKMEKDEFLKKLETL